jgi:hypothetical protein
MVKRWPWLLWVSAAILVVALYRTLVDWPTGPVWAKGWMAVAVALFLTHLILHRDRYGWRRR